MQSYKIEELASPMLVAVTFQFVPVPSAIVLHCSVNVIGQTLNIMPEIICRCCLKLVDDFILVPVAFAEVI